MTENEEELAEAIINQGLGYSEGCREDNYYCHYCNVEMYTKEYFEGYPPEFKHEDDCQVLLARKILW